MRKIFLALLMLPALSFAQVTKTVPVTPVTPATTTTATQADPNAPIFKFKEEMWDFGTIPQGIPKTHVFEFENAGKDPLVVSQVTASCGCTTPEWTKEPVLSGKTGAIKVTYNAAKEGAFTKTVTILSNTGAAKYLTIKGNVIPNQKQTDKSEGKE